MMSTWGRCALAALAAVAMSPAVAAQRPAPVTPPRILSVELPALPSPTVAGGGEVVIEATIDANGSVSRPVFLRSTPPYSDMILGAIARWRFRPARAVGEDGTERTVEATVVIAAIYRPPTLFDGPTVGEPPTPLKAGSSSAAVPVTIVPPLYPPLAVTEAVVVYEVLIDEAGQIREARSLVPQPAFDEAAASALRQWKFLPASHRGRPAPTTAYAVFGFRAPVMSGARPVPPKPQPKPVPLTR